MLLRSSFRQLLRHPAQAVLAVVGVGLGVAVVVGVDLARASAERSFRLTTTTLEGKATHQIRGGPRGLPDSLVAGLQVELGLTAAPIIEAPVRVAVGSRRRTLTLLGVDPWSEAPFRSTLTSIPGTGAADANHQGLGFETLPTLLTTPNSGLLARDTAAELGIERGGTLVLTTSKGPREVTIIGLLEPADEITRVGLAGLLIVDLATAQELLGLHSGDLGATDATGDGADPALGEGRVDHIDLLLTPSQVDDPDSDLDLPAELTTKITALLPPDATLEPAGARSASTLALTRAFRVNLLALSLLALVCGGFLIFNTIRFSVVARRGAIGRLRALGVTRREVFVMVLGEALLIGAVGTGLGIAGGIAVARALVGLVTRTISDLYFVVAVRDLAVDPTRLAVGVGLGLLATLVAALQPAWEATATPPRLALQRSDLEEGSRRRAPLFAISGALLVGLGLLLLGFGGRGLAASFVALFLALLGVALTVPLVTLVLAHLAAPPLGKVAGLLGRLAARGLAASLSRTAVAIAALAMAVAVAVGVTLMIGSFRRTVEGWLGYTLQADLYVTPRTGGPGSTGAGIDPQLVDELAALPGVARLNRLRTANVAGEVIAAEDGGPHRGASQRFDLVAVDMDSAARSAFALLSGDPDTAWAAFDAGAGVLITEPLAWHRRIAVGDHLRLAGANGPVELPVVAVFRDYASDRGSVLLSLAAYRRAFADDTVSAVSIYAAGNGSGSPSGQAPAAAALREKVDALVTRDAAAHGGANRLTVQSNQALRQASLEVFDRTFAVTGVLRLLTSAVAFAGVLAALLALALERQRELGVLRALGLLPRQVFAVVLGQTALLGLVAGLVAVPLGAGLAAMMVRVINRRSFGWSMELWLDPAQLLTALGLALLAALLAGIYPAWTMARTSPAEALRGE